MVHKAMCMNCLQLVPTKSARSRKFDQPWVTSLIRRLYSEKQSFYNHAKRSGLLDDWKEYHAAKKLMQKECRQAHNRFFCVRYFILILVEVTKTYGIMLNVNGMIK